MRYETIVLHGDEQAQRETNERLGEALRNALMGQSLLVTYYEDTLRKVQTPEVRAQLQRQLEQARRHLEVAEDLYRIRGLDPSAVISGMGRMMTPVQEMMANILKIGTGAYHDLQQLFLLNFLSAGGFAVVQSVAVAVGDPRLVELIEPVLREKFRNERGLQEMALERSAYSVLTRRPI